ncbi:CLM5 protein, partial [Aegotheles bennettii]|nr:CLM5 protein [Aegotheles bennettii]
MIFTGLHAQAAEDVERHPEGSTLFLRCPYTSYTGDQDKKFWCRMRDARCDTLVETTYPIQDPYRIWATKGNVTIEDNLVDRTVYITMTNLQLEDSGTYSCAYYAYNGYPYVLKTILLIVFKELHRTELDSLSVQCQYGAFVQSTDVKVWCRGDARPACEILVRTPYSSTRGNSKDSRASIQDDTKNRMITITMQKLQAQDTGLYWCATYKQTRPNPILAVMLSVSKIVAGTTLPGAAGTNQSTSSDNTPAPSSNVDNFIILIVVLSILFILVLISLITLGVKWCKQPKRRGTRQAEETYEEPENTANLDSTGGMEDHKDDSNDLKYATLNFKSQLRPALRPEDPLYSNVGPSQTRGKPAVENVEYATIA